jgi:hypothetical protein
MHKKQCRVRNDSALFFIQILIPKLHISSLHLLFVVQNVLILV